MLMHFKNDNKKGILWRLTLLRMMAHNKSVLITDQMIAFTCIYW